MAEPRIGYSVPEPNEDLQKLLEDVPQEFQGYEARRTPEGDLYYVPSGKLGAPEPLVPLPPVEVTPEPPPEINAPPAPQPAVTTAVPPTKTAPEGPPTVHEELQGLVPDRVVAPLASPSDQLKELLPTEVQQPESPPNFAQQPEPQEPPLDLPPEQPVPEPEPQTPDWLDRLMYATAPVRRLGVAAGGALTALPWQLGALLTGPRPVGEGLLGPDMPLTGSDVSEGLWNVGEQAKENLRTIAALPEKPQSGLEQFAGTTGEMLMPAGKATVPLTAAGGIVKTITDALTQPKGMDEELANLLLTPAEAAPAPGSREEALKQLTQGLQPEKPKSVVKRETFGLKQRKNETDEDFARRLDAARIKREEAAKIFTPTAQSIVNTVGGPKKVSDGELAAMGILGATTIGMMFAPWVFRSFKFNRIPQPRTVKDSLPGTAAISSPADLARAYDDITSAAMGMGRKAGIDPVALNRLDEKFRIQTRNGARALADSAVQTGKMETPAFTFNAPVSLTDMARASTPESNTYLKLLDTFDQLNILSQQRQYQIRANPNAPVPAPPNVAGMDMQTVLRQIHQMEQAHPEVVQIRDMNRQWLRAVRNFEGNGEYATRPMRHSNRNNPAQEDRSVQWLNSQRPNEIAFLDSARSEGMSLDRRGNPIKAQARAARRAIRARLENEAIGEFVDESRKAMPELFTKLGKDWEKVHPEHRDNVISFYRRGIKEDYYTPDATLADVLKTNSAWLTSMGGNAFFATKRLLEFGTTGMGAPAFSLTSAMRSYWIAKFTAESGFRSPTIIGSILAVPQQLYPQIAKSIARGLEDGAGGRLSSIFNKPWVDALSRRLAKVYDDSVYAQLKAAGSHRGSILEQQMRASRLNQATNAFSQAVASAPAPMKAGMQSAQHFWNAWRSLFESIHNGPGFNFVKRNFGAEPLPSLALRARRLTGDPRAGGQYYVYGTGGKAAHPIRFVSDSKMDMSVAKTLQFGYGMPMEWGRDAVPWFNATLQGGKRIGEAYLHDPVRFTRNVYQYALAPAASLYLYARSLGNDPNGRSYADYLINGRSAYNRQMNLYVPIPGRPVEDGIEVTFFHELNPFKRGMEIALDHAFGSNVNTLSKDFWNAAYGFLDTAVIPPTPPLISALLGTQGLVGYQGLFGGEAYKKKNDPFDQTGGLPTSVELTTRALMGSVAESLAGFYAAYTHTPEGWMAGLKNGMKEAGKINLRKTPLLRDVTGVLPDVSGNTDLNKELFERQNDINELLRFYQKWILGEGKISTKAASKGGAEVANQLLGPALSEANPGLTQPTPTNPLYIQAMQMMYDRFKHESPNMVKGQDQGGIGFRSIWRRYGDATEKLSRLKNIDAGNYVTWQRNLENNPEARDELQNNGVDTTDLRQVRSFYQKKRQDAGRVIIYMMKAVENELSQKFGKPITFKDLKPFAGPEDTQAPFIYPELMPGMGGVPGTQGMPQP